MGPGVRSGSSEQICHPRRGPGGRHDDVTGASAGVRSAFRPLPPGAPATNLARLAFLTEDVLAPDAQTSPVTPTSEPARSPVSEEPAGLDWSGPGVVPSDAAYRPTRASEPEEPRQVPPDVIVEVAPEVAPEVRPAEEDPARPFEPSEVITEVAPER
jgi:hypothetical protein